MNDATFDPAMPHVDGVEHRFVEVRGMRVHVAEAGEGPPLLLLHGWPQHWYCWHRLVPLLPGFRLVMPDMRGFGWSDVPDTGYDKENLATDVLALMEELDIERAGIIGHDWGGWIGFLTALRAPERVAALFAVSIAHPFVSMDMRTIVQSWRFGYQLVLGSPLGRFGLRRPGLLDRMLTTQTDAIVDPRVYSDVIAQPGRARASELLYRTFLVSEAPRLRRYRDEFLDVPTVLAVGDRDPVIRPSMLDGFEDHADAMTLEIIRGAGHFLPEEAPVELAALAMKLFVPCTTNTPQPPPDESVTRDERPRGRRRGLSARHGG